MKLLHSKTILSLNNINAGYGQSQVLHNVSLSLNMGKSLAVLGRNGAGKTTLINTIMGLTTLHSGQVVFNNSNISNMPAHKRAIYGLGWVPQERAIFPTLTVKENLTLAARAGAWNLNNIFKLFPILLQRISNYGDQLSGGEQQMLAIARALMANPRVLLLDEPLEGLAPRVAQDLLNVIAQLLSTNAMAVVIVEQHPKQVLALTDHAIILDRGQIVYSASANDLLTNTSDQQKWLSVGSKH